MSLKKTAHEEQAAAECGSAVTESESPPLEETSEACSIGKRGQFPRMGANSGGGDNRQSPTLPKFSAPK
jgi:hypothetical protein